MTGTLLPADISLLRRGTHVLQVDGKDVYYVESETTNLRRYERKPVVLEGTLSANVDPSFLPVLEVSRVVDVLEQQTKEWSVPALGLALRAPETWEATVGDQSIALRAPGSTASIMKVERMEKSPIDLLNAMPTVVGTARALRVSNEQSGAETVVLERSSDVLVFSFTPEIPEQAERLRQDWLAILETIRLQSSDNPQNSSIAPVTGTGTALGTPCGGPAGILCPPASYCDITNLQENIGVCKSL
jgi:hypothetical protein